MSNNIMANSVLNAASGLTLLVTGFACSIVAARLLGPEASGTIAFSLWLATTGSLIAELGTGVLLMRILPQLKVQGADDARRLGFAAYLMRPVVAATLLILAVYGAAFAGLEQGHWVEMAPVVVAITGALFLIQSIGSYSKNFLIGEQRVGDFFRLTVIASLLQLVAVVAGALLYGTPGALGGYLAGQVVLFAYSLRILFARVDPCGLQRRELASSSFLLSLEYIVTSIFLTRFELLFLQKFHSAESVGFYAVALSLANLALQLPVQLTGSLLPYYAEKLESSGKARLPVEVFEGVVRSLSYITLPMSFGLAAIAPELVVVVFGPQFGPAGPIVAVLALFTPVFVFSQICTQYLFSQGQIRQRLLIDFGAAALMAGGCLLLVPGLEGTGAAIARGLVFLAMCLAMTRLMKFDGSMHGLFRSLLPVTAAAALCGAAAYGVAAIVGGAGGLVLAISAGAAVYVPALRLCCAVPREDADVILRIAGRLPRRGRRLVGAVTGFVTPQAREA
ncbi:oligosaccharide flippase family protein [Rhizobiaceae bacterium BDR2-2]|uniref:Oligosaccharide flippase family protein n=1 Tax=Ectorhizobium quercum TaxID=2965071 RepID=A0AAE3N3N4_9HYPH|nr:oligosaccharide flippase family protein [Ectorhizobium quercum]MCX8999626.1 oligosaccharide flippase family protein [Ectorhizobium quercum]